MIIRQRIKYNRKDTLENIFSNSRMIGCIIIDLFVTMSCHKEYAMKTNVAYISLVG